MKDYNRFLEQHKIDVDESQRLVRATWVCSWIGAIGLIIYAFVR